MRVIEKGTEPSALQKYRVVPGATYDGKDFTPVKDEIRQALLRDQLALCCYCMCRISSETRPHPTKPQAPPVIQMKVEHWQSQTNFPSRQLAWANLLGACLGGEGSPRCRQTCDTRKGDDAITLNPLNREHISTLYCRSNGRLESSDPQLQKDIDDRLRLNYKVLVGNRKASLDRALHRLRAKYPKSEIPARAIRACIAEMETPKEGQLPAFGDVLQLWARKRFMGRCE